MAVSMADITKLRKMTGAGMMDCKNALTEAEGDFDKAMEIIKKLNLKYPKKNAYFADQIRFMEKLIINTKSK